MAQIEVMKDAAKAWKDLSDEDKQPYKEAANGKFHHIICFSSERLG